MDDLLEALNEPQRQAVLYNEGPLLVIAGAGSGKTRVLTHKIAYLLQQGVLPYRILALTFTNKAAREMKERIAAMVGPSTAFRLWMGTFHSIFARILRTHAELLGFPSSYTIYDSTDSRSLIKAIIRERGLDDKIYKPGTVQSIISGAKNALITPEAYVAHKEIVADDIRAKRPEMASLYKEYRNRCRRAGAMDFDDLLLYTNILLRDHPEVADRYRSLFAYILVDEYQDTNLAQHLIVRQLAQGHGRLCVVGDDAQSIYSFRGAQIGHILNMQQEYPGCRIFKLEQNYRSTQSIVLAANSLIRKNKGQIAKNSYSENEAGDKLQVLSAYSDFEEGHLIANRIQEFRLRKQARYDDFAVLYRTNAQSRIFEEALRKQNIPYRIYGGLSFYQRKEIKDVIAYFRMIVNPRDEEALKRVINYPARGIGDTTLKKIADCAVGAGVSLWEVVCDPTAYALPVNGGTAAKLKGFRDLMFGFAERNEHSNVLELARDVLRDAGILRDLQSDPGVESQSKRENLEELLNGIREFCQSRQEEGREDIGLVDFLSEVSLITDQDRNEEEDGEKVTLMTVHASKGLEFDHVFVVGLEEDLFPTSLSKNSEMELEEERRLLYVAITRARKSCTLSYAACRYRNGQPTASPPSRFIRDIDEIYLDLPPGNRLADAVQDRARQFAAQNRLSGFSSSRGGWERREPAHRESPAAAPSYGRLKRVEPASGPAASYAANPAGVQVGQTIRHDRFGRGRVERIEGTGDNCKISVRFEQVGEKQLLLRFARFTVEP